MPGILINNSPREILFAAEGIRYVLRDTGGNGYVPANAVKLTFYISYYNGYIRPGAVETGGEEVTMLAYSTMIRRGGAVSYYTYTADLTDIVMSYTKRLYIGNFIKGYATVQLVKIDGEEFNDDSGHICLYGISGGIDLETGATELPADSHPFLLARANENGALCFYRSELAAMEALYAAKPGSYDSIYFDTDDLPAPDDNLDFNSLVIRGRTELLGIRYYAGDEQYPYDVTRANAIFLHLTGEQDDIEDRMYAIAVQDEPETDEAYLIRWTNSMGAPEALLLTGELQDASEIENAELYTSEQTYQRTVRKRQRGIVTTKYTLHTGYLTPARIVALKDMLCSEEVELKIDNEWVPVSVTTDAKHAAHQREPEDFELTIEVLEQTRYTKPDRQVAPIPGERSGLLQDNIGNIITDNKSNTIH